ncbi:hypothetical protein NJB18091_14660 [Mycobacterium marinum]|nr:hypothetical protein NJB18091_14660 [Mycobacterium marinum]
MGEQIFKASVMGRRFIRVHETKIPFELSLCRPARLSRIVMSKTLLGRLHAGPHADALESEHRVFASALPRRAAP